MTDDRQKAISNSIINHNVYFIYLGTKKHQYQISIAMIVGNMNVV